MTHQKDESETKYCMCQRSATRGCFKWKPKTEFKQISRERWSNLCIECLGAQKEALTHRQKIQQSVKMANDRARARGVLQKDLLKVNEACNSWTGVCPVCEISISLDVDSNKCNRAVIDRVDCSFLPYAGNMQWMCTVCNNRKQQRNFQINFNHPSLIANNEIRRLAAGHGRSLRCMKTTVSGHV